MSDSFESLGTVTAGELALDDPDGLYRALRNFPDQSRVVLKLTGYKPIRSMQANKLYWAGFVKPLSEHTGYEPMWIHAYLKKRFLSGPHLLIQNKEGVVIDEADLEPTTTTLNEQDFGDYLRAIQVWAQDELRVTCGSNREVTDAEPLS